MEFASVLAAAEEVQRVLLAKNWRFCFIGGLAVQRWGANRFTQDVDLTLLTGFGSEEVFIDEILRDLHPRRPDGREFALHHRVLLVKTSAGVGVDIAMGAFPFEERSVERASDWEFAPARRLRTCSAEDLLIHKVFAGRNIDWFDVENILLRQKIAVDLDLIRRELNPLLQLKGEPESLEKFEQLVTVVARRLPN